VETSEAVERLAFVANGKLRREELTPRTKRRLRFDNGQAHSILGLITVGDSHAGGEHKQSKEGP
jgi:hypothetical protein